MVRALPLASLLLALASPLPLAAQSLRGVVDTHAHSAPDRMPRSIDAIELARLAKKRGLRALVLKNHYESTASLAELARRAVPGLEVFGGIALNRAVGGINPAAVEYMVNVDGRRGRVVWMPTFDAENQVRHNQESRPSVAVSKDGRLLPAVLEVLDLIARHDLVLATGHSSPAECLMLAREARRRGVKRILVTHATNAPIGMSVAEMREAAGLGAYIEFAGNAVHGINKVFQMSDYVAAIRQVGVQHCILSSDYGQKGNPLHPDGLEQIFAGLRQAGLSPAEIEQMAKTNPARLLGLP